jgi:hypothetical protein
MKYITIALLLSTSLLLMWNCSNTASSEPAPGIGVTVILRGDSLFQRALISKVVVPANGQPVFLNDAHVVLNRIPFTPRPLTNGSSFSSVSSLYNFFADTLAIAPRIVSTLSVTSNGVTITGTSVMPERVESIEQNGLRLSWRASQFARAYRVNVERYRDYITTDTSVVIGLDNSFQSGVYQVTVESWDTNLYEFNQLRVVRAGLSAEVGVLGSLNANRFTVTLRR